MTPPEIERYFHRRIPLTAAMRVRVDSWDGARLVLSAPLDVNHNHLGTAFGGSLNALAMLAGYGLIWLLLDDPEAHVVIRRGTVHFHRPVSGDLRAVCVRPPEEAVTAFRGQFAASGKARLALRVHIPQDKQIAVEFDGLYVARTEHTV